jgi:hypothetical protein
MCIEILQCMLRNVAKLRSLQRCVHLIPPCCHCQLYCVGCPKRSISTPSIDESACEYYLNISNPCSDAIGCLLSVYEVTTISLSLHASREITQFEHLISTWQISSNLTEMHAGHWTEVPPKKFPSENYALCPLINFVVYSLLIFAPQ